MRRWRVLAWSDKPEHVQEIVFHCVDCDGDARLPTNASDLVIAQLGHGVITDLSPSSNVIPDQIECPHCRRRFGRAPEDAR